MGAVISNLICLPISDKLIAKIGFEEINQTLIIDGIMSVREGKSPNLIREMLVAYLPEHQRSELELGSGLRRRSGNGTQENREPPASRNGWVTFADLMSLLVCFFVLIISFSIQDQEKLQVVAGSMKDAFGIMKVQQKSGVIERDGNPERTHLKNGSPRRTKSCRPNMPTPISPSVSSRARKPIPSPRNAPTSRIRPCSAWLRRR